MIFNFLSDHAIPLYNTYLYNSKTTGKIMIDKEKFEELYQYFEPETIIEIIDLFGLEKKERIESMHKDLALKQFEEIAKRSHALKGLIGNFMADEPYLLACDLEKKARAHDEAGVLRTLEALEKSCDNLLRELREIKYFYQKVQDLPTGSS